MVAKKVAKKNKAMRKPKAPAQNKAEILAAAASEFAARGVDGARIDSIARQIRTTRAMIYYYFRSKENLYLAVLENAYREIREAERKLELAQLPRSARCAGSSPSRSTTTAGIPISSRS